MGWPRIQRRRNAWRSPTAGDYPEMQCLWLGLRICESLRARSTSPDLTSQNDGPHDLTSLDIIAQSRLKRSRKPYLVSSVSAGFVFCVQALDVRLAATICSEPHSFVLAVLSNRSSSRSHICLSSAKEIYLGGVSQKQERLQVMPGRLLTLLVSAYPSV